MMIALLEPLTSQVTAVTWSAALAMFKVTLVLLAALAVTHALRKATAGARHLVWLVALAAVLVIPVVSAWAPVTLRVLPSIEREETVLSAPSVTAWLTPSEVPPAPVPAPRVDPATSTTPKAPANTPAPPRTLNVGVLLIAFWSVGVVAVLGWLALGAWSVRRIVRRARTLESADWQQPLFEIADRLGLSDAPELLQSDRVAIPFASGMLRCRIVLPAESEAWSPERRSAVLMHELGHVRRRDVVGHTMSRIVCALYWFHPLVWTAARRLRVESERACDDLVLGLGARPSEYAEHLLDIVSQVRDRGTPAVALAMAHPNEFEGRMLAILDPRIRRRGLGRAQAAWLAGSLAALALFVGAIAPAPRAAATSAPPTSPTLNAPTMASLNDQDSSANSVAKRDEPTVATWTADAAEDATGQSAQAEPAEPADSNEAEAADQSDENSPDATPSKDEDGSRRVAVLAKALRTDTSPEVRRVAAWGLEQFAEAALASESLVAALTTDADEDVREMAAWALSESQGGVPVTTALQTAFRRDKSLSVRRTAAWAAGSIRDHSAVPGLVELLAHTDPSIREVAAWSIGSCEPERAPAALVRLLSDPDPEVRLSVAWALREIEDPETADELEAAFNREKDPEVQQALIRALGAMGDRAIDTLTRLVTSPDPKMRAVAIAALAGGNASEPWPWPRPEPRPFP